MGEPATVNGQQGFRIDLDRAPELLKELDGVREKYRKARDLAQELSWVTPPFADDVTIQVFKKLGQRAQGGEGSLYDTASGMIKWIDDFKAAIQKAIDEHKRIDDENRMA